MARRDIKTFADIPNIGKAMARDLVLLGLKDPAELIGRDPYALYAELCALIGQRQDYCVLDTFIAAVRFMEGGPATKWWAFTAERKRTLGQV
ncbi:MAG: helix-hairpin-helix domain-containing protein [Gammaproteobacteria bacterium]